MVSCSDSNGNNNDEQTNSIYSETTVSDMGTTSGSWNIESDDSYLEDSNYENSYDNNESDYEHVEFEQKSFNGDIIISGDLGGNITLVLLQDDGTVIAKGSNDEGQLGNGGRIDSNEWVMVNDLRQHRTTTA